MIDMIEQTQLVVVEPGALDLPALPDQPADRNPMLVYLAGLAPGSRRATRWSLTVCCQILVPGADPVTFPWGEVRYQHTRAIRAALQDSTHAPATSNRHLACLRGVLKESWRLGLMGAEEYQRAVDLKPIRGDTAPQAEKGRHVTSGELSAMLAVCSDRTFLGARDAAMIAILYCCGLRRAELAALQLEDYDTDAGTIVVCQGKGRKERVMPVPPGVTDALADWLHVRGRNNGPLFMAMHGAHILARGLNSSTVWSMIQRRAKEASVRKFAPHDLRRTFAGDLLDAGADIVTVQKLMGHSDVTTTARYDRRGARAKRAAVNKLHIAYTRQWED